MTNIFVRQNVGFKWFNSEKVFVKGFFFDSNNQFYCNSDLLSFFESVISIKDFKEKIKEANGVFTVIIKIQDKVYAASDTTRMFPLFYSFYNNEIHISDDVLFLKEKLKISEIDRQSEKELLAAAHTLGNKTLFKNLYQLQSDGYIYFAEGKIKKQGFFFSYSTDQINTNTYEYQKEQAKKTFQNAFERLILSLNNKHVVIPLSGGYDSRLIAAMLKKQNFENVTCYTYGKRGSLETENACKTAEKLKFKWIFIELNDTVFEKFLETTLFKDYAHYAGKLSSMPFLQEYFAVKFLKENKKIPENSVFIPGHSGDLLGGSQLVKVFKENLKTGRLSKVLLKKKFFNIKMSIFDSLKTKKIIRENLICFDKNYKEKIPYSVAEDYDIKEKISKFIFNSSSVYNFFGYEQRFPFWDKELLSFFKNVPYKYKRMKLLYNDVLKNTYFEPYELNFKKELQVSFKNLMIQKVKNNIKLFLPGFLKKKLLLRKDLLNSFFSTKQMEQSLIDNKIKYKSAKESYNEIIIQWYLYLSEGMIKQE